jgi:NAD(P)-dependent dehydrogenase (short-subunit alcohol dehydrogenase family)
VKDLRDKVAVVTGGGSGIGLGIARSLRAQGMQVVIADIEYDKAQAAAAELGARAVQVDVTRAESVEALARETVACFGKVHLLCNNAGIGPFARVADLTRADWKWMLDVNLWGVIHGIDSFLPLLRAHGEQAHIVNTASLAGFTTMPGLAAYSASKAAVVALSETLAAELAASDPQVGVTVLAPGPVRSNIANSLRNRPGELPAGKLADMDIAATELSARAPAMRWLEPAQVGDIVVRAVTGNELYAFTHPEMFGSVRARFARIEQGNERAAARQAEQEHGTN